MAPLVRSEGVVKRFAARGGRQNEAITAVAGVSVELEPGDTLGLVGESGCGKSTLGRLLLRLLRPDGGRVEFDGRDLDQLGSESVRRLRPRMQIVFQNPYSALNPRMLVRDIVQFNLAPLGLRSAERNDRTLEAISLVGLGREILHRYPHQLSGGQAQRVGIARALVTRPEFIVADEIVSALDVSVQADILELLKDLRNRLNLTTLFISHNLNVVRHVCSRAAVMYKGRIVETGPTRQLYAEPRHPYTRLLLASVPGAEPDELLANREKRRADLREELSRYDETQALREVAPGHFAAIAAGPL